MVIGSDISLIICCSEHLHNNNHHLVYISQLENDYLTKIFATCVCNYKNAI